MARHRTDGTVRDQFGNIIASADVSIYLAGTSTEATVYDAETGGNTLASAPQLQTDSDGQFEFWVDDGDYDHDQKFRVVLAKTGWAGDEKDNVNIPRNTSAYLVIKDADGTKHYMEPDTETGALLASTTKTDIV